MTNDKWKMRNSYAPRNLEYKREEEIKIKSDRVSDSKQYWQKALSIKSWIKNKTAETKSPEKAVRNSPWANIFLLLIRIARLNSITVRKKRLPKREIGTP